MDCLFCKIVNGEIPAEKVYEDEKVLAFKDINPAAPVHVLVIPKQHITSVAQVNNENSDVIAHIFEVISHLTKKLDLEQGYRVVTNTGEQAGQTVLHLHFHILGGRKMRWPAG